MKAKDYRVMGQDALEAQLKEAQDMSLKLRFRRATATEAVKTHLFKEVRRNIAKIQTILREMRG